MLFCKVTHGLETEILRCKLESRQKYSQSKQIATGNEIHSPPPKFGAGKRYKEGKRESQNNDQKAKKRAAETATRRDKGSKTNIV